MRATFAIAALAGSAFAAPGYYGQPEEYKETKVVVETVYQTQYVNEGYEAPKPTPVAEAGYQPQVVETTIVYEQPAKPTSKYEAPVVKFTPAPKPAPAPEAYKPAPVPEAPKPTPTPEAPKPAPSPSAPAPAPSTPDSGYMGVVEEYRKKLGMKALTYSTKLESNAKDTVASGAGVMKHKLNPGTYGQVLAPGKEDDFLHVFVGGWLCEIPTLPGLNGECGKQSEGWSYEGQTGHADILTSNQYSNIACAFDQGIWCCDLA